MATVVLFHHAHGRTAGVLAFAESLQAAGHDVHVPDLFDGRTFDQLEEGVAYAEAIGFEEVVARGTASVQALPDAVVYLGLSLGALPAQALALSRPGARGAVLAYSAVPLSFFGRAWPAGLPLQMHVMHEDPMGDYEVCRALAGEIEGAEFFVYPGSGHLFAERESPDFDADAAGLLLDRTLAFLARA